MHLPRLANVQLQCGVPAWLHLCSWATCARLHQGSVWTQCTRRWACTNVPQTSADGRQAVNNAAKYGIPTYAKPLGQNPSHNLLADKNLLCAGKFFTEAKWVNSKEYMAGLPADAYGCLQWNVINTKHGELITAELQSVLTDIGMHRMPTLNMFNMYKIEFLYRRHQSPADGHRQPKISNLRARFLRICHRGTHALC